MKFWKGLSAQFQVTFHAKMAMPDLQWYPQKFVWSSLNEILMFTILETDFFQLWFLYKRVLSQRPFPKGNFPTDNFTIGNFPNVRLFPLSARQLQ